MAPVDYARAITFAALDAAFRPLRERDAGVVAPYRCPVEGVRCRRSCPHAVGEVRCRHPDVVRQEKRQAAVRHWRRLPTDTEVPHGSVL